MFGKSTACKASAEGGDQQPECPDDEDLQLPFENYPDCCQVNEERSCDNKCPVITHDGTRHKYQGAHRQEIDQGGGDILGGGKYDQYNCACKKPTTLLDLQADYERWPQTVGDASLFLQEVEGFDPALFKSVANATDFFPRNTLLVLDKTKWQQILLQYNESSTRDLDIATCLKKLDKKPKFELSLIWIGGGILLVIVLLFVLTRPKSNARRTPHPPERYPSPSRSDSTTQRPMPSPRNAGSRRPLEEEEED